MNIYGIVMVIVGAALLISGAYNGYRLVFKGKQVDPVIIVFPAIVGIMLYAMGRMMV